MMPRGTLTRQLFFRIVPAILITILAVGIFAFHSATREINIAYDAQLINNANILWVLMADELQEKGGNLAKKIQNIDLSRNNQAALNADANDYAIKRMFRIWRAHQIIFFTDTAPSSDVPEAVLGFSYEKYDHEKWRVYAVAIPNSDVVIEVGETTGLRDDLVDNILGDIFWPLFILIPIVGGLVWIGINEGLGTIRTLVRQIRARSPHDLSPVMLARLPEDLKPLGESINQLLGELHHSLAAERRFADHAAHQLRTPLAGLKLLLQMYAKADSEEERAAIMRDLHHVHNRAARMVEQLLQAARVSHQSVELTEVKLHDTAAAVLADMAILAADRNIKITLAGDKAARVQADANLLRLLIENILDNAIKYSPLGGEIAIQLTHQQEMWSLCIQDSGPGIPEDMRSLVFQYFYRVEATEVEGTGLGLAIVDNIVERLRGTIQLKTPETGQGLLVEVWLQAA